MARYQTATAFRAALDVRLRTLADARALPLQTVRLKIVMERLLARLFHDVEAKWLLKGGYASELRFRPHARTTRDIDLSIIAGEIVSLVELHAKLSEAARLDLKDWFQFRIGTSTHELQGAPEGGARFPCE